MGFPDGFSVFCSGLGQLLLLLSDIGSGMLFDEVLLVHCLCLCKNAPQQFVHYGIHLFCPICRRPITDLLVLCAVIALINGNPLILPRFRVVRLSGSGCKNAATAVTAKDIARKNDLI